MSSTVDATAYRPPRSSRQPARDLNVDGHQCLRIGVTVATVWVFAWSQRPGTNFAFVDQPDGLEDAHLSPGTIDALLEIAPIVEPVDLLCSPSWPMVAETEIQS